MTNLVETLAKDNKGDAAVWEATGDLYALKDDAANAAAAYRRMGALGPAPLAAYKTARAYQRVRDTSQARAAYEAGIKADAAQGAAKSSGLTRHLLYQGLASLYLADGRDKDAATALLFSARVKPDPDAPYALRFDVADALRKRGYAKEVRAYAQAVLLVTPDDETAKRLAGESGVGAVRR